VVETLGKATNWREIMRGFGSTVDHPTTDFVPELMAAFPDAKVILTERDNAAVWWKSFRETILRMQTEWSGLLVFSLPPMWSFRRMASEIRKFQERMDGPIGPESYEAHNKRMREVVPKEKLLVFNVKKGWEPLCAFLGVQVPEGVPFPRSNETAEMHRRFIMMRLVGATAFMVELGLVTLLVWGLSGAGLLSWTDVRRFLPI
jgi:hypothetical protein